MISENIFSKCAPAKGTDIKRCGSVTICNAIPMTQDDLDNTFKSGDDYKVLEALFKWDFEIRLCEAPVNGLYDFLMSNRVNLGRKVSTDQLETGLTRVRPFVMGKQYSPINNVYWKATSGQSAGGGNWQFRVESTASVPFDIRTFATDEYVYVDGRSAGGTSIKAAYKIVSATAVNDNVGDIVLEPMNDNSYLDSDRTDNPTEGLLRRGTNNKSDYEAFCHEDTSYTNWKYVPFWMQTSRWALCNGDLYREWRKLILEENAYYAEFQDLGDAERNRQLARNFQDKWVNDFFFNKPLANQDENNYTDLENINVASSSYLNIPSEGKCVGKRANATGVYEQLAQCDRIFDAQGDTLNLPALLRSLYTIWRVRRAHNPNLKSIDIFTDSVTADRLNTAFIAHINDKINNTLRVNMPMGDETSATHPYTSKGAKFGFYFRSYQVNWPIGLTVNVCTHDFFDDAITAGETISDAFANTQRVLWILDFTGIYPGIITSRRKENRIDQETLKSIDSTFNCVMEIPEEEKTLTSVTWAAIIECPAGNLIIENFGSGAIEAVNDDENIDYNAGSGSTTTTTTT